MAFKFSATRRNMFYKAVGIAMCKKGTREEQLSAAMNVINELDDLVLSKEALRFFELCKTTPWLLDVFDMIAERRKREPRESKSAEDRPKDPAAEFFDIIRGR